jgi:hypothetical protein
MFIGRDYSVLLQRVTDQVTYYETYGRRELAFIVIFVHPQIIKEEDMDIELVLNLPPCLRWLTISFILKRAGTTC